MSPIACAEPRGGSDGASGCPGWSAVPLAPWPDEALLRRTLMATLDDEALDIPAPRQVISAAEIELSGMLSDPFAFRPRSGWASAQAADPGAGQDDPPDQGDPEDPWATTEQTDHSSSTTYTGPRFGDDCVPLPVPDDWGQCLPKRNFFWLPFLNSPFPIYEEELLEICGKPPCRKQRLMPGPAEWDRASKDYRDKIDNQTVAEIVSCAWALLQANVGPINWLECVITGNEAGGGCLRKTIGGSSKVKIKDVWKPDAGWNMRAGIGGPITLNLAKRSWDRWIDAWNQGSRNDRACVCATVAGVLLHEIWHTCLNTGDAVGAWPCSKATNLEHSFTWAMSHWYPQIGLGEGCESVQDDGWWYNTDRDKGVFGSDP